MSKITIYAIGSMTNILYGMISNAIQQLNKIKGPIIQAAAKNSADRRCQGESVNIIEVNAIKVAGIVATA